MKNSKILKKILCMSLAMIMMFSMTANVFASENSTDKVNHFNKEQIMQLEPYITVEDGLYKFDSEKAIKDGFNHDLVAGQKLYMEKLNNEATLGNISIDTDLKITSQNNSNSQIALFRSCPGMNTSIEHHWWGYSRYADNCESKRLVSDLNTAAAAGTMVGGAAGIATLVFPGAALVAGGAAIDAGYWSLVATRIDANNQGRGVYIEMTWALVFNITPQ